MRYVTYQRTTPDWLWDYVCHCSNMPGWTYDPERNLWVCRICRKPSVGPYLFNRDFCQYISNCILCDNEFVVHKYPGTIAQLNNLRCEDCGGANIEILD